ncbi:MAG: glycosyltransferase family 2 protein [Bacteroidetes bacterium]|nr:glycosyltransferase family 2 protein [Bacteroidota bacterium]
MLNADSPIQHQPLFTIVTISYNSGKWIKQSIESVLASSFTDFEYLISDDCSSDNTWNIIEQYNDLRIRAWRNKKNIGEYPNRNKALYEAKGKYILFVDGDDILYKNSLRNLSEYVRAFPGAGMLWGLNPQYFPFYIFPYQVLPEDNMKLIYLTHLPIANIGFGEMLFKTEELKKINGFDENYKMGDTFIKKRLAITVPVLYVNIGFMFWRQSPQQSSKQLGKGLNSFFERIQIDTSIINEKDFPCTGNDKAIILRNIKISQVKLFVKATLLKGNFLAFFKLRKRAMIEFADLKLVFKSGSYTYSPSPKLEDPLMNNYNFE